MKKYKVYILKSNHKSGPLSTHIYDIFYINEDGKTGKHTKYYGFSDSDVNSANREMFAKQYSLNGLKNIWNCYTKEQCWSHRIL